MTLGELAGAINRRQQSRRFKTIVSIALVTLSASLFSAWLIYMNAPNRAQSSAETAASGMTQPSGDADQQQGQGEDQQSQSTDFGPLIDTDAIRTMIGSRKSTPVIALAFAGVTGLSLIVVWLGVGLTYLGLLLAVGAVAGPLLLFDPTRGFGQLLWGVAALTASFTVLMQTLRLAFSRETPTFAIARNVLNESVRMSVSLVFIVALMVLLAGLPGVLDEDQPLRYRVQSFMQYGVSGTFWTLALMTLFFSAGTVAFEQRDRIIWQTMAKPVSAAQYLFGKWLGVVGLNAALLGVCASGVFLFTEHLANQTARGEVRPFVNADGSGMPTEDRLLLHSQVLTARVGKEPNPPVLDQKLFDETVEQKVQEMVARDPAMQGDLIEIEKARRSVRGDELLELEQQARSIPPGRYRIFVFEGLERAKKSGKPITLRYLVHAGGDDPNALYRITFGIGDANIRRQVALNISQTISLKPEAIDDNGRLELLVANGDPVSGQANLMSISFPPDGLEILYAAGGYELNFVRVMAALWVKLAFIAAVAIAASTFLSFPIACMFALLVLFAGETAGFLMDSLNEYQYINGVTHRFDLLGAFFRTGGYPIAWIFQTYAALNPTAALVDGRLVSWGSLFKGLFVISGWSMGTLVVGWAIFRKRELAIYSGH